jgi:poly(A) polymerase
MAEAVLRRLKASNELVERVEALVRNHLKFADVPQMREATLKRFLREPGFEEHLELHRLDCLASHGKLEIWRLCRERLRTLEPEKLRPRRLLSGQDLIGAGYVPGPAFKQILDAVEDAQLDGRIATREQALELVSRSFPREDAL